MNTAATSMHQDMRGLAQTGPICPWTCLHNYCSSSAKFQPCGAATSQSLVCNDSAAKPKRFTPLPSACPFIPSSMAVWPPLWPVHSSAPLQFPDSDYKEHRRNLFTSTPLQFVCRVPFRTRISASIFDLGLSHRAARWACVSSLPQRLPTMK